MLHNIQDVKIFKETYPELTFRLRQNRFNFGATFVTIINQKCYRIKNLYVFYHFLKK